MGTPNRTSILLNVNTVLNTITVANGYKTTVALVEKYLRGRDDVPVGSRPYLGFGAARETPEHEPCNQIYFRMPLVVIGHVSSADWTTRSAALNNLIDDTIAAMENDTTRGGYAISSKVTGVETDEADPDADNVLDGGTCIVEFEIYYVRAITAS